MRRIIALATALALFAGQASAADNYGATAGTGLTFAAKDVAGIKYPWFINANSSGTEIFTSGAAGYVQVPSGGIASGAVSVGAFVSGSVLSGAFASGSISDGAQVTLGSKADAKNAATDTTAITVMQVLKEISSLEQAPASRAVTNAGTFAVQATLQASGSTAIGKVDPNTIATWGLAVGTTPATAPTNTQIVGAIYNSSAPSPTTGQVLPLQLDASGNLNVNIKAGAGSGGTALADQATFTQGTTSETPMGCLFNSSYASGTTGKSTVVSCTAAGSVHTTVDNTNANGSAVSASSSPVVIASDQAAVAIKAASASIASGAIASGAVASGAYASGAVSSGAYASGSLASGAVVDLTNISVAPGSAPPTKAIYLGANASGATGGHLAGIISCDQHLFKHITSATDTLAVQGVASQAVYVCGALGNGQGAATWFLENTASTNANCSSSNTQISGVNTAAAGSAAGFYNSIWGGMKNTAGNGLCINSTGTGGVDVDIWYAQL